MELGGEEMKGERAEVRGGGGAEERGFKCQLSASCMYFISHRLWISRPVPVISLAPFHLQCTVIVVILADLGMLVTNYKLIIFT